MKCPHCGYIDGWNSEKLENVDGEEGKFFSLPISLERQQQYFKIERRELYACPSCLKTFIGD